MADIDWPTSEPFRPVLPYSFGVSTPKSGTRGFYSGENETAGHLADRFLTSITLPPCSGAAAAPRSAFLMGALSRGDRFRFRVPHHPGNSGTLAGPVVVSANALAGARSVSVSGGLSGVNLLRGSGFEVDSNADNVADGWAIYSSGAVTGGVAEGLVAGNASPKAQRLYAAVLGPSDADQFGVVNADNIPVTAGASYTFAVDVRSTSGGGATIRIVLLWLTAGLSVLPSAAENMPATVGWLRRSLSSVAPPTAAFARVYVWMQGDAVGAPIALEVDNAQFERSAAATAYAGAPTLQAGDFIGVAGNLLQVAYGGSGITDAGAGTVPLTLPLARPITAGAGVTLQQPVGLWQIDTTDGISFDFSAPVVQMGVTIPFRQVIV